MEAKVVAPKDIEKELTTIWDALEGQGTMRACLYNLIVYSSKCERTDYLREIAKKTITKFPSRILFVTVGEKALETQVSVMRAEKIACDLIDIHVSEEQRTLIPFLLLPHLVCDLPTYILWADDPTRDDPIGPDLKKMATRIIYDSECAQDITLFAKTALARSGPIADLNWARIEGWRALLSNLYRTPDRIAVLKNTKRVHITYNSHQTAFFAHTQIQALYLKAHLTSCMKWENVDITLEPVSFEQIAPGRIVTIEIESNDGDHTLIQRSPDIPHQIVIQNSTATQCSLPSFFVFAKYESGQSLVNEICHQGTSKHFRGALELIAKETQ